MAVHFITRGLGIDGAMVHRADPHDITVGIMHYPHDGYKLGYDGQVIKEELGLREFVKRLAVDRDGHRGYNPPPHEKIDHDVRRILSILSTRNDVEIQHIADTLDKHYSNMIMRGKLVLAEHTVSMQRPGQFTERESIGNTERSMVQSEKLKKQYPKGVMEHMKEENMHAHYPMTPDEAYRVDDKEVYYLLT
jgi:hypothetical protein